MAAMDRYAESSNSFLMILYCIVEVDRARSGKKYRIEQHFTDASKPGLIRCQPVLSMEQAKQQGERLWLTDSFRASLQFGMAMADRVCWSEPTEAEISSITGVIWVLRAAEPGSAPVANDGWKLWYKDLFDLECPAELEVSGEGLERGLVELWMRHLNEGVNGLSRFSLAWRGQVRHIELEGRDMDAMQWLRRWIFHLTGKDEPVERKKADIYCLVALAACHARLIRKGETIEPILQFARIAPDISDFVLALEEIGAPLGP
jgi:hypothetical protein